MKKIILAIILIMQPILVFAAQPLSRDLVTSFYAASDKLDTLEAKYPQEFKRLDEFSLSDKDKIINYINGSRASSDIRSVLSANGFSSFEDFFNVSIRLMGSMYSVQMENMPAESRAQLQNIEKSFNENIKMMKQNGMPESMIAGMKAQLQDMKVQQVEMKKAAKKATKADKKFVSDNFDWLMSIMPEEEMQSADVGGAPY